MQVSVLFGILLTILNKNKVTRDYLATKYEVSKRTVSRYVDVLSMAKVPILSLQGKNGGYSIASDFRLDRQYLTEEEQIRILTCLNATSSSFSDSLSQTISDKILNLRKNFNDESYVLKTESLIIETGTWGNPDVYRNKISVLNRAISGTLSITMSYIDRNEYPTTRTFDPYTLVLKEGMWYVYGYCHFRSDFRLFKLGRIKNMVVTDSKYIHQKSDINKKISSTFDYNEQIELSIEFSSIILTEIEDWLGLDSIRERDLQYVATAQVFSGNQLLNKLLSLGSHVKVLSPLYVKEELMTECKRILTYCD